MASQAENYEKGAAGYETRIRYLFSFYHLVPASRIEELLTQAGFSKTQRFFQNFMLGGWIAFKGRWKQANRVRWNSRCPTFPSWAY